MIERAYLADKYARALMRHYRWFERDLEWIQRIFSVACFIREHRRYFFHAPRSLYALVFRNFGLESREIDAVLVLLDQHQRLLFLPDVLTAVVALYQKQNGYEECRVSSAHALTDQQKAELKTLLEARLHKKIYCSYDIDTALIAGVKVRGQSFFWEDSVAHRLRMLEIIGGAE